MITKKDFYWTITKSEYLKRLKILNTPYHQSIWNYLQAYIIRGSAETTLWNVCYGLYKVNGLLASHTSIRRMCNDLNISNRKVIDILNELDKDDHIIKYTSKSGKINNTNIYILGFINTDTIDEGNIRIVEKFFVNRTKEMKPKVRKRIIELYDTQIKTSKTIEKITKELAEIQKDLFNGGE